MAVVDGHCKASLLSECFSRDAPQTNKCMKKCTQIHTDKQRNAQRPTQNEIHTNTRQTPN